MEAEERPRKLQKVFHDNSHDLSQNDAGSNNSAGHLANSQVQPFTNLASVTEGDHKNGITVEEITTDELAVPAADQNGHAGTISPQASTKPSSIEDLENAKTISKNQQKKLRRKLEWESKRDERKVLRKEKTVARRERKKAVKQAALADGTPPKPQEQIARKQLPITILIDCDFDDLMRDNERISLGSQLTRSYSDTKRARFREHLAICSFGGKLRERFDGLLQQVYKSWRGVRVLDSDFVEASTEAISWMTGPDGGVLEGAFQKYAADDIEQLKEQGEIVYLSADATETLEELKPYSTYIVGGLVDKNREKGLCFKRATQRGVRTAKLPIGQYLDMKSRAVLTVNQVCEIMIRWLEVESWGQAFIQTIPPRKGGKLKEMPSQQDQTETPDCVGDAKAEELDDDDDIRESVDDDVGIKELDDDTVEKYVTTMPAETTLGVTSSITD